MQMAGYGQHGQRPQGVCSGSVSLARDETHTSAILDMKIQRDKLHQYQRRITLVTDRETTIARTCLAKGDRAKALLALRRKKYQQSLLTRTDAQLETLEQLTADVEFALVQKDVLFGLQQGTTVLKQINAEMGSLSSVEKLMGDGEEARLYQAEISDMLQGEMSTQDEEEVEQELEQLAFGSQQTLEDPLPRAPTAEISVEPVAEPHGRDKLMSLHA